MSERQNADCRIEGLSKFSPLNSSWSAGRGFRLQCDAADVSKQLGSHCDVLPAAVYSTVSYSTATCWIHSVISQVTIKSPHKSGR